MRSVRDKRSCCLRSQLQDAHEEKEEDEKSTSRKSKIVHREEFEDESIDRHRREEHKCCAADQSDLNARDYKKEKHEAS
jgi:hypothetical protein